MLILRSFHEFRSKTHSRPLTGKLNLSTILTDASNDEYEDCENYAKSRRIIFSFSGDITGNCKLN